MTRRVTVLLAGFLLAAGSLHAQPRASTQRLDEKGTFLGLLFGPVSETLYAQLPQLPRNEGVVVTGVLADSPAAKAELMRHDIVFKYNGERVRDSEHLARLIHDDKPGRKVQLAVLRGGQEKAVEATLALGPVLKIAPHRAANETSDQPKGIAKPNGPAAVNVAATPLEDGKLKVTIEYYQDGTGKLRTVVCQGEAAAIDTEVDKLPDRERQAVRRALQQIREMTKPKATPDRK